MSRSDIFDSFVKIAQEKGIISNDSSESKKKLEKANRADSLSISDIEALYGVKPNIPENMEYENNIMENAHPNSVVVSPSHNKINGLVENNNERQNIILNILNKTPNGLLTQHKYAERELISALVSVANDLDNKNKDDLRVLADACLMQVCYRNNYITKKAVAPAAAAGGIALLPVIIGVVGLFGAIYAHQHLPNLTTNLKEDYDRLMGELNDLLTSHVSWGVGLEYDQELKNQVKGFEDRLKQFWTVYEPIDVMIRSMEMPRDADEMQTIANSSKTKEVIDAYEKLLNLMKKIYPYIDTMEKDFKSSAYKARHVTEKGFFTSLLEKTHLSGGNTSLIADDFQDVVNAIPPFKNELSNILQMLLDAKSFQEKVTAELKESQSKLTSEILNKEKANPKYSKIENDNALEAEKVREKMRQDFIEGN